MNTPRRPREKVSQREDLVKEEDKRLQVLDA